MEGESKTQKKEEYRGPTGIAVEGEKNQEDE
jgi:hypothetical protein